MIDDEHFILETVRQSVDEAMSEVVEGCKCVTERSAVGSEISKGALSVNCEAVPVSSYRDRGVLKLNLCTPALQ